MVKPDAVVPFAHESFSAAVAERHAGVGVVQLRRQLAGLDHLGQHCFALVSDHAVRFEIASLFCGECVSAATAGSAWVQSVLGVCRWCRVVFRHGVDVRCFQSEYVDRPVDRPSGVAVGVLEHFSTRWPGVRDRPSFKRQVIPCRHYRSDCDCGIRCVFRMRCIQEVLGSAEYWIEEDVFLLSRLIERGRLVLAGSVLGS